MEIWRPIEGRDGYEISDTGRVRSLIHGEPRLLHPCATKYGHCTVIVGVGESRKATTVHALVMSAFGPAQPPGTEICHNDGDPSNNTIANLRWGTHSENVLDTVAHGRHNMARKTHCPQGHPYDSANTIITKVGGRRCRACRNVQRRRRYASTR